MNHQKDASLTFVDIVLNVAVDFKPFRRKGILVGKPGSVLRAFAEFRINLLRKQQSSNRF
jgi:hypothetical protein